MGYFLGPLGQFFSEIWPPYYWKPWMSPYVDAGAFFFRKMAPRFFKSHGPKKEAHDSKKNGMAKVHQWIPIKLFLLGGLPVPQTPWRGACSPPRSLPFREAPPLGLSVDLGTKILVPRSWHQDPWYQDLGGGRAHKKLSCCGPPRVHQVFVAPVNGSMERKQCSAV